MWIMHKSVFLVGASGSGKTTSIVNIIANLSDLTVATVKYIHHPQFTIDPAGKDTRRHRDAGAIYTVCAAPKETAILIDREERDGLGKISAIVDTLPDCDLILFESYNKPVVGAYTILCGNTDDELNEFYEYVKDTDILAVCSHVISGKWRGIRVLNTSVTEDLDMLTDMITKIL